MKPDIPHRPQRRAMVFASARRTQFSLSAFVISWTRLKMMQRDRKPVLSAH